MEHVTIKTEINVYKYEELPEDIRQLADMAMKATDNSYSPYSGFRVGAAVRLEDGMIVVGANQENAAFPVAMCAERAAIFNAQSNHPQSAVTHIAISARNSFGFVEEPVSPCGSCRQVILEMEHRYGHKIRIYLCGAKVIYEINGINGLLPLSFTDESMR